jgi:hypothetical protein
MSTNIQTAIYGALLNLYQNHVRRDLFAMSALRGLLSNSRRNGEEDHYAHDAAETTYALLARLDNKETEQTPTQVWIVSRGECDGGSNVLAVLDYEPSEEEVLALGGRPFEGPWKKAEPEEGDLWFSGADFLELSPWFVRSK